MLRLSLAAAVATGLLATAASAQNYGSANLVTGFTPDPHTVSLQAGGGVDASSEIGGACVGNIAAAPDYQVFYTAGDVFPLSFAVGSDADTTLVINAPDGSWHCNDDFNGLNPQVTFSNPMSGQYDIWVGTYWDGEGFPNATLYVTEVP